MIWNSFNQFTAKFYLHEKYGVSVRTCGLVSPEQDRLCFNKKHEDRETERHKNGECRERFGFSGVKTAVKTLLN